MKQFDKLFPIIAALGVFFFASNSPMWERMNANHSFENETKSALEGKLNNFCYYEIPSIILGMPLFNLKKCSDYVYEKLVSQGFKVTRVQFNKFMIYF